MDRADRWIRYLFLFIFLFPSFSSFSSFFPGFCQWLMRSTGTFLFLFFFLPFVVWLIIIFLELRYMGHYKLPIEEP